MALQPHPPSPNYQGDGESVSRAWLSIRCWAPHNPPSVSPFWRAAGNGDPEVGTVGDSCSVSAQLTHKEAQSHVEVTPLRPGPSSPPPSPLLHLPSAHPIEPPPSRAEVPHFCHALAQACARKRSPSSGAVPSPVLTGMVRRPQRCPLLSLRT